jgi:hypothetical protein
MLTPASTRFPSFSYETDGALSGCSRRWPAKCRRWPFFPRGAVYARKREIAILQKTIRSVTATQTAKNIPGAVRGEPSPLAPSFRGIAAMGSLRNRRRNAPVSEHFTLNKSRISSADRVMQFIKGANQGLARTVVSQERCLSPPKKILINLLGSGLRNPGPSLDYMGPTRRNRASDTRQHAR